MPSSQPFDVWQPQQDALRRGDAAGPSDGRGLSILRIETIRDVQPLDTQIGVFPKQTVPTILRDVVFGEPAPSDAEIDAASGDPAAVPPLNTYAILDAASIINLPEMLEDSGLEHRCLFRGEAYTKLKSVAPWIVRLEEDNGFTRNLFTRSNAGWHLWDREPGIFLRSRGSLDEMCRHFRKFTKVQDENGKWFYSRFWDSKGAANPLFDFMSSQKDGLHHAWFFANIGAEIKKYIYFHYKTGVVRIASTEKPCRSRGRLPSPVFSRQQRDHYAHYMIEWRCYKIAQLMKSEFNDALSDWDTEALQDLFIRCTYRMRRYGIRQQEYLKQIFFWEVFVNKSFEVKPGYEPVLAVLNKDKREPVKFEEVKREMELISSRSMHGQ